MLRLQRKGLGVGERFCVAFVITHAILSYANITWVKTATYYMGKIGIVYMGNIDGSENNARSVWAEQERLHSFANARRGGNTGQQGESTRNQSQRTDRAHSADSFNVPIGKTYPGGTVSQLIADYRSQVASKQSLIQQTQEEIDYLQSRIQQFEELAETLEEPTEEPE